MRHTAPLLAAALTFTALAATPQSLAADTLLDGPAFERYTTGRTLTFSSDGMAYGIEQYLPGRRVRWAFVGDQCQEGVWYERDAMICFVYDYNPVEQCWSFYRTDNGLRAIFQGPEGPSTELYEVEKSSQPLTCGEPEVGV